MRSVNEESVLAAPAWGLPAAAAKGQSVGCWPDPRKKFKIIIPNVRT